LITATSTEADVYRNVIAKMIFDFWGEEVKPESAAVDAVLALFEQSRQAKMARSDSRHMQESQSTCDFDYQEHNNGDIDGWEVGNDPFYVMSAWRTVLTYLMTDYKYLHE
jgi:hypothetical protein